MANMETLSEFKSCLKNICVLWTYLFSTWEVEKKKNWDSDELQLFWKKNHPSVSQWTKREHNKDDNS